MLSIINLPLSYVQNLRKLCLDSRKLKILIFTFEIIDCNKLYRALGKTLIRNDLQFKIYFKIFLLMALKNPEYFKATHINFIAFESFNFY